MKSRLLLHALLATGLVAVVLAMPQLAAAQTSKLVEKTDMIGQTIQTPYINYNEYQNISVNGRVTFRKLLTVQSVREAVNRIGKPDSTRRTVAPDGQFTSYLYYRGGTTMKFRKFADGTIGLQSMESRSPEWSLIVGGTDLRPGMPVDRLSPAVRKSLQKRTTSDDPDLDHFSVVHIAKPGSAKSGDVELLQDGKAQILVYVNAETGIVERIRFSRLGP